MGCCGPALDLRKAAEEDKNGERVDVSILLAGTSTTQERM